MHTMTNQSAPRSTRKASCPASHTWLRLAVAAMGLSAAMAWSGAMAGPVNVFSLDDVRLDGDAGENTFGFATNSVASPATISVSLTGPTVTGLTLGNLGSGNYGYFASYFASQTLTNVGDKLVFSFTAQINGTITGSADGTLRLGLFDSKGTRAVGNKLDTNAVEAGFNDDRGYRAFYRPDNTNPGGTAIAFDQRTSNHTVLYVSGAYTALPGSPAQAKLNLAANTDFSGTFTVEKTLTGTLITSNVGIAGEQTVTDTVSPFTDFDMLSLFMLRSGGTATALSVSSLSVDFIAIPEPASLALLGLGGLVMAGRRRRS